MTTVTIGCPSRLVKGKYVPDWLLSNNRYDRHTKAAVTKAWRNVAGFQARADKIPAFDVPVSITATPHRTGKTTDVDAIAPTVKAVVDGLVDAGVIPDDSPEWWPQVTYRAPIKSDIDFLIVELERAS